MGRVTLIGIDTGGTFTDAVRLDGARRRTAKVPSTPDDPARAVLQALEAVGGLPEGGRLCHGSTVGTNAVLTRDGARVVLLTTAGFEDVLHLDRGQREDLHALMPERPEPLLAREASVGVAERMGADGAVVRRLTAGSVKKAVRAARELEPEAVAVCLLHAVRWPRHERELVRALKEGLRGRGVRVHASEALCADGREAERAATTVLDAYVGPKVIDYVARIARRVPKGALTVMRSDGGRMAPAEVRRAPARTLLSGPAAGAAAAHGLARRLHLDPALSFDVGGTSTDVAWLEGRDLDVESELIVGPHRASVPSLPLETVGAGGGSLVWLDEGGALRVGPRSSGAVPGPACYGQGGPFTLTDAWLLLDRLPDALLGGSFSLDRKASEMVARPLAKAAGCSLRQLADGVVRVAAVATARALRRASLSRGHDPRGAALIAFGGAGPMLAAETAEHLDLSTVVVPLDPGTFAAEGTLVAPLKADASRAVTSASRDALNGVARALTRSVRARLEKQGAGHITLSAEIDVRYEGQAFDVTVPWASAWRKAFEEAHARRYGFASAERTVEVVRLRVRGQGHDVPPRRRRRREAPTSHVLPETTSVVRNELRSGDVIRGPVRIEEHTGTTWVPAGWAARRGADAELWLERAR